MGAMQKVHSEIASDLNKHFSLQKVQLKYPFPVSPSFLVIKIAQYLL